MTPAPPSQLRHQSVLPIAVFGSSTAQCAKPYQEDRLIVVPELLTTNQGDKTLQFIAVYDGHSSHKAAEHAKNRLHEVLAQQQAIQNCTGAEDEGMAVAQAFAKAFSVIDKEIIGETASAHSKTYGTTAVCALRVGDVLYVAHTGDSRAVLCRKDTAFALTKDHKPTDPEERRRIEAAGGKIKEARDRVISNPETSDPMKTLNMSRSLGDPEFKEPRALVEGTPDVIRVELARRDDVFVLLASDGVLDVLSDQKCVETVLQTVRDLQERPGGAAQAAADELIGAASSAGAVDNCSCVVMLLEWD